MLNLRQVKHLARVLDTPQAELSEILGNASAYYKQFILRDPRRPGKERRVVSVTGDLRRLQSIFYRRVLLPRCVPSDCSFGGIKGRDVKKNVTRHLKSQFVYKADISDFYPSIHHSRVYKLFTTKLGCSPDVARLLTRLCTYEHHLALGLITSPLLADQVLKPVDSRIQAVCAGASLVYTRYVDDITISGEFDFSNSGIIHTIPTILGEHGFRANQEKSVAGALTPETAITGLRIVRGHVDVPQAYLRELDRQIVDVASLATGGPFEGPYFTKSQILGRVCYVAWVNPNRRARLRRKLRSVDWKRADFEAKHRGLIVSRQSLEAVDNG